MAARAKGTSLVGYTRVSSALQDALLQRDALNEDGCVRVFEDKVSSRRADRAGLIAALDYLRPDDTLCAWKLDRLGRSVKELLTIADDLHERGIALRILTGRLAGIYTPTGEGKSSRRRAGPPSQGGEPYQDRDYTGRLASERVPTPICRECRFRVDLSADVLLALWGQHSSARPRV